MWKGSWVFGLGLLGGVEEKGLGGGGTCFGRVDRLDVLLPVLVFEGGDESVAGDRLFGVAVVRFDEVVVHGNLLEVHEVVVDDLLSLLLEERHQQVSVCHSQTSCYHLELV